MNLDLILKDISVFELLRYLEKKGYYCNISISDVQDKYICSEQEARKVIEKVIDMKHISPIIDAFAQEMGLKEVCEELFVKQIVSLLINEYSYCVINENEYSSEDAIFYLIENQKNHPSWNVKYMDDYLAIYSV